MVSSEILLQYDDFSMQNPSYNQVHHSIVYHPLIHRQSTMPLCNEMGGLYPQIVFISCKRHLLQCSGQYDHKAVQ